METVVTVGESLVDFVPTKVNDERTAVGGGAGAAVDWPLPAFQPLPGGAPANVAACVARLGGRAAFVGLRGDDVFGAALEKVLRGVGVDTRYFRVTGRAKTGLAFVALDAHGDRSFSFYRDPSADMLLTAADVPLEFIAEAGILHVGGVSLAAGPSREATLYAAREAKRRGVFVSYDPNWRPALWPNPAEGVDVLQHLFPFCDLVKVNREELRLLAGTDDPQEGAARFHAHGVRLALITLDKDGCYFSVWDGSGGQRQEG
ncbi:MAG: carbohydrate kinase, partial [Alicyclobacillaceae bacterium]|nr:carbohydrate kinase [Alicyclobacillaceae bacterium]